MYVNIQVERHSRAICYPGSALRAIGVPANMASWFGLFFSSSLVAYFSCVSKLQRPGMGIRALGGRRHCGLIWFGFFFDFGAIFPVSKLRALGGRRHCGLTRFDFGEVAMGKQASGSLIWTFACPEPNTRPLTLRAHCQIDHHQQFF